MYIEEPIQTAVINARAAADIFGSDSPISEVVQVDFLPQRFAPRVLNSRWSPRLPVDKLQYMLWGCPDVGRTLYDPLVLRADDGDSVREVRCHAVVEHWATSKIMVTIQDEPADRFWAEALFRVAGVHLGMDGIVVTSDLLDRAGQHFQTLRMLAECQDFPFTSEDAVKARRAVLAGGDSCPLGVLAAALGGASALDRAMSGIAGGYLRIDPTVTLGIRSMIWLGPLLSGR